MMKTNANQSRGAPLSLLAVSLLLPLATLLGVAATATGGEVPDNFDNQGKKLFTAQQQTPTGNLK